MGRMVEVYLSDRVLLYDTNEGQRRIPITYGAAQGSIPGSDLWNVSYVRLLKLEMPDETQLIGYADDVAALIAARDVDQAKLKLRTVIWTRSASGCEFTGCLWLSTRPRQW